MPKTYYDSELTGAQIEYALEAIHGVVTPSNNSKVLYIDNGQIKAASASRWGHGAVLEPLSVTVNGDYTPPAGTDGFDSVHVAVPGTGNIQPLSVAENGTYNPPSGVDGYAPVTVDVQGGASIITDTIEQGGLTADGLNDDIKIRLRSKNFIPVTPGQNVLAYLLPSEGRNVATTRWQISVSCYSTDDYTVPRIGFIGWEYCSIIRFAVPSDANYVRLLIGMNGGATIIPTDISGAWLVLM